MCIATPEKLLRVTETGSGLVGEVLHAGRKIQVDLSLVPQARPGDIALIFRASAIRLIDEAEAARIQAALGALADVMDGVADEAQIEAGFADLIEHPAQLPEHLQAQLRAQSKERHSNANGTYE